MAGLVNSGVVQPAAGAEAVMQSVRNSVSSARSAFGQLPAKKARVAIEGCSRNKEGNRKTLLLQLKLLQLKRKLWEARRLFDGSGRQTIYDKLAVVGNAAVLQNGANTNDRMRIVEVRRYTPRDLSYPLHKMVVELGADLLPDVPDEESRIKVYESWYGIGVPVTL